MYNVSPLIGPDTLATGARLFHNKNWSHPINTIRLASLLILVSSVLFSGCASKTVNEDEFTGFLDDYSRLEPVTFADGSTGLRWVDPQLQKQNPYTKILLEPVTVHSGNLSTDQVSASVIAKIKLRVDNLLRAELGSKDLLTDTREANVLSVSVAITGINAPLESFKIRELIPLKLVVSGAMAASGARDRDTALLIESIAKDSVSGATLGMSARKGLGVQLENDKEQVSEAHLEELINKWVIQWVELIEQMMAQR